MAALSFKITADASEVTKELNKASNSVQAFAGKVRKVSLEKLAKGADQLAFKLQKLAIPELNIGKANQRAKDLDRLLGSLSDKQRKIQLEIDANKSVTQIANLKEQVQDIKKKSEIALKLKSNEVNAQVANLEKRVEGIRAKGADVPLNIGVEKANERIAKLQAKLKGLSDKDAKSVKLEIEALNALKQVGDLKGKIKELTAKGNAKLKVDSSEINSQIGKLQAELQGLKNKGDIALKLKSNEVNAKVANLQKRIEALRSKGAAVPMSINTSKANERIAKLEEKLKSAKGKAAKDIQLELNGLKAVVTLRKLKAELKDFKSKSAVDFKVKRDEVSGKIAALKTKLQQLKDQSGVDIKAKTGAVAAQIDGLQKRVEALRAKGVAVPLNINTAKANERIEKLQAKLKGVSDKDAKGIHLQINALKAVSQISKLKQELQDFKSKGALDLKVNSGKVNAQIANLRKRLSEVRAQGVSVKVNMPVGQVAKKIDALKSQLSRISNTKYLVRHRIETNAPKAAAAIRAFDSAARRNATFMGRGFAANMLAGAKILQVLSNLFVRASKRSSMTAGAVVGLGRAFAGLVNGAEAVGRAVMNVGIAAFKGVVVAATAAVTALGVAMKNAASEAMNLERLEVQFSSITGSVDEGAAMVSHLREESKRTGVEVGSMATMMRRLLASGMNTDEAKKMTASLLDISGALGLSNEESKLLGIAISQVASKGVVSMEELRQQIAEKGVPVFDVMADKLNVTKGEFMKMVADGKVGSEVLIEAFSNLEGPLAKFRGGADRMAATTGGAFARVKAQIKSTFAEAGKPLLDGLAIVVNEINKRIQSWGPAISGFAQKAGGVLKALGAVFQAGDFGKLIRLSLSIGAKEFVNHMFAGLKTALAFFTIGMIEAVKTAWSKITDMSFWQGIGEMFKSLWSRLEAVGWRLVAAGSFGSAKEDAEGAARAADGLAGMQAKEANSLMRNAGDGRTLVDVLQVAAQAAADEYRDALKEPLMGTEAEKKQLEDLWRKAKEAAEAAAKAREEAMQKMGDKDDTPPLPPKPDAIKNFKPIVSSMQRIGGAALGSFGLDKAQILDQKRNALLETGNGILKNIENKLTGQRGAVYV